MQNSNPKILGHASSGTIYETGITDGYAYTKLHYNADNHTVTILYSTGYAVHLDASRLGRELLIWAARCAECRAGQWPDMRLGPVGERLADRYVEYARKVSA